jgi:O-antigen/teichoic acid export membrane protein
MATMPPRSSRLQPGARSSALLAAATAASLVAAYAFLLAAGRILGSEDYGSLAALLGLLTIILLPAGALQMALSREISRSLARGDERGAARLARGTLRAFGLATVPLVAVTLALAPALSRLLNIDSTPAVIVALLSLSTAFVFPIAMGVLQGEQRFVPLGSLYVIPWLTRLVVLGLAAPSSRRSPGLWCRWPSPTR